MATVAPWREIYDGGSPEAERAIVTRLAADIVRVQEVNRRRAKAQAASRTFHAKLVVGVTDARLLVDADIPERFRAGPYQPGAEFGAMARLSNANGVHRPDALPDMRGVALRLAWPDGTRQDLLATSYPVSHARNARQFVKLARLVRSRAAL